MAIETFWALPAKALQQSAAFRSTVTVTADELLYLDARSRVWRVPSKAAPPIYEDSSEEWRALCAGLTGARDRARATLRAVPPVPDTPLHKWNVGFEWKRPSGPFRFLSQHQIDDFDDKGWFVLEGAVSPSDVAQLAQAADDAERKSDEQLRRMKGGKGFIARADEITFTTHLVNRVPLYRKFYASRLFTDVCFDLIGPDVRLYWDQAVYKKPGVSKPFPWHQDNGYTFVEPQAYLTFWVGLDAAREDNGCMWMMPRVHRLGTIHHDLTDLGYACYREDPAEAVMLPTRPGDVIVFSSLTPHKTGHNATAQTRRALVSQFVPDRAIAITEDPWGRVTRTIADRPDRQFPILVAGEPCEAD